MRKTDTDKVIISGLWYTLGNFLTKSAGFITTPIFTRLLTKTEMGDYSNFVSWIELLIVICTIDLYASVMLAKYDYKDSLDDYIATNLYVGTGFTIFILLLSLPFRDVLLDLLNLTEWQINVAFIYMAVYPASQMFLIKSRIFYKYKSFVAYSFATTLLSTVVSLLLTVFSADRLQGRIYGQYIPLIIANILIYLTFVFKGKSIKLEYVKYGIAIAVPLIWHTLAGNILSLSDRVMIRELCGSEATALYSVGYYCALIVSVLWSSMNNAWSPWAYDMMDSDDTEMLKKASVPYVVFFSFIVLIFLLIGPEILLIMGGSQYSSAENILPPIMISVVFQFVYSLYVNIEYFYKKQIYIAIGTSIAAVTNLILNLILIPVLGYSVAAYTTLVGYIVLFVVHYCFVRHLGKSYFYNTKFFVGVLSFFLTLLVVLQVVYKYLLIRYGLVIILLLVVVFRAIIVRNELKASVKNKSLVGIVNCFVGGLSNSI